jgi:glycosyltransferase involved in cell wall biosynthesis
VRIAVLSWRDSTHPDGGGSEVYIESVGRELVARGHRVTLVCARPADSAAAEVRGGVQILRRGGRLTVYPRALLWLVRHRREVDVVLDVINGVPFGSPLVRRRGVVALVHHLHREQWRIIYPGLGGRAGWFVESRVVPLLYRRRPWLTVSQSSARDLAAHGVPPSAISVARNGVTSRPGTGADSPTPLLCVLARLVPHKQIEHTFEVVARLAPELPDLRLSVIGDGWWRDQLVTAATELGVADRVTFHGHVSADERDLLLRRSWLMLLPSVKEGWGLAVTEAALQATPTVAYASAGGVNESILHGETGLLVADLSSLTDAARELLLSPETRERLGRRAREVARGHTWSATADVVEDVLRAAAAQEP